MVRGQHDDEPLRQPRRRVDGVEQLAQQPVGLGDRVEVGRRHPARGVTGDVRQREVKEREPPFVGREVGDGVVDQCVGVAVDLELVDRVRPRPVEGGELVLAREQGRRAAGVVDDVEDRATPWPSGPGTVRPGSSSFQVTPWPPASASIRRPVSMPVWLGSVTVCSTSVRALSGRRTLAEQPPEGAVRPEPVQGTGVEPVDGDGQHVAPACGFAGSGGASGGGAERRRGRRGRRRRGRLGGGRGGLGVAGSACCSAWGTPPPARRSRSRRAAARPRARPS